jgi:hypothetical protein
VFDATPTPARAGPEAVLATFTGYLQADAYTGYDAQYRTGRIVEVGYWAHARRRFVDALETDGGAAPVLALIQQIYQVEREFAAATPEARRAGRQAQAAARLATGPRPARAGDPRVAEVAARRRAAVPGSVVGRPATLPGRRPALDR